MSLEDMNTLLYCLIIVLKRQENFTRSDYMEPNRIKTNEHLSSMAKVTHSETERVSRCGLKVRHLSRISLCSLTLADRTSPHHETQKVTEVGVVGVLSRHEFIVYLVY